MISRRVFVSALLTAVARSPSDGRADEAAERTIASSETLTAQSASDPTVTVGFQQLLRTEPWLTNQKKTIGYVRFNLPNGRDHLGSALLVDVNGHLLLCKHEIKRRDFEITFVTSPEERFKSSPANVLDSMSENTIDIALAQMDRSVVKRRGLVPAEIGPLDLSSIDLDARVIIVGFARGSPHLHAVNAQAVHYEKATTILDDRPRHAKKHRQSCLVRTEGGQLFPGNSGGGVYSAAKLVGMTSAADEDGNSLFVPLAPLIGQDVSKRECLVTKLKWLQPERAD